MSESMQAVLLAHQILDRVNADPDDDLAILSRQLLRAHERLAALPPAMIWTTQKPSKPGWYWWREPEHNDGTPEICHVYRSEGGELRVLWTTDCTFADLLSEYDGEWSGPIAPPLEPPQ